MIYCRDEQGRFIADYIDYAIVYQLLEESFAESLGDVKRYTDDRIQMIENAGMMTPRDLAEMIGVSTAAISQWSKGMIEKGVLTWCDETGVVFGMMTWHWKKRSDRARRFCVLRVVKVCQRLFSLTGDPRWDNGGELYVAYDLELDHRSDDSAKVRDESFTEIECAVVDSNASEQTEIGVKVLSEKLPDGILKFENIYREKATEEEINGSSAEELFNQFDHMLSKNQVGEIN
jgi:DNA-binding XRE family transcriptional regulator